MHDSVQKYKTIISSIKSKLEEQKITKLPKIIAVSKTFELVKILPLIEFGHLDYGENKVQEAKDKWGEIKLKKPDIRLHLIGKLQTNKVKLAVKIFDYIHSVDSEKLAKKIAQEVITQNKKIKIFIQVNIGDEDQKSGVDKSQLNNFCMYCKELNLDVVGLMCIPPTNDDPDKYFKELDILKKRFNLLELSMGMSSDYLKATDHNSTYLRIGSSIFGKRN
jgi:pyridoxal phosphate enzyme (YggS family)|tara:strand:- start:2110 stop:2769 length:660 start_codon:yes stop_codon:yes gene_type:complete